MRGGEFSHLCLIDHRYGSGGLILHIFLFSQSGTGYGADGYVERITISREQYNNNKLKASIKVTHKSDRTLKKYYQIQEDGMHIVKK